MRWRNRLYFLGSKRRVKRCRCRIGLFRVDLVSEVWHFSLLKPHYHILPCLHSPTPSRSVLRDCFGLRTTVNKTLVTLSSPLLVSTKTKSSAHVLSSPLSSLFVYLPQQLRYKALGGAVILGHLGRSVRVTDQTVHIATTVQRLGLR